IGRFVNNNSSVERSASHCKTLFSGWSEIVFQACMSICGILDQLFSQQSELFCFANWPFNCAYFVRIQQPTSHFVSINKNCERTLAIKKRIFSFYFVFG